MAALGKSQVTVVSVLTRTKQQALDMEVELITYLKKFGRSITNVKRGGQACDHHTVDSRQKQADAMSRRMSDPDYGEKMRLLSIGNLNGLGNRSNLGLNHSEATKKKMSLSHIGRKKSVEWRAKIAVAHAMRGAIKHNIPFSFIERR